MDDVEEKLAALGYTLPGVAKPVASYVPWVRQGDLVFISGQLPLVEGRVTHTGAVGDDQTVEAAQEAARLCALNVLAIAKAALGSLEDVAQVVQLNGFVQAVPGFPDSPKVINGASDLMEGVLGERGRHSRAAVGVAALPLDATVEIQAVVAAKGGAS